MVVEFSDGIGYLPISLFVNLSDITDDSPDGVFSLVREIESYGIPDVILYNYDPVRDDEILSWLCPVLIFKGVSITFITKNQVVGNSNLWSDRIIKMLDQKSIRSLLRKLTPDDMVFIDETDDGVIFDCIKMLQRSNVGWIGARRVNKNLENKILNNKFQVILYKGSCI